MNLEGEYVTKVIQTDDYELSNYSQIAYCQWGYHHVNGKDKDNGSMTTYCTQVDLLSNMHDTKIGPICWKCYDRIPKKYLKPITIKK